MTAQVHHVKVTKMPIVPSLASPHTVLPVIRELVPRWRDVKESEIELTELRGGVTNKILRASCPRLAVPNKLVVRIYGNKTEVMIDRVGEIAALHKLSAARRGPTLYGQFANGLILDYVEGSSIASCLDLRQDALMQRITLELATWHSPPITEPHMAACAEPMLFVRSREWLGLVPQRHSNAEVHAKLTGSTLSTDALAVELLQLESLVAHVASPIVFCHNDALAFNMIVQPDGDMMLCDVEYGAYNYRGFDIGNHWCEWTGFELDATRFPDKAQQLQWCKYYLDALRRVDPTTPNANTSPEQLRREGQACTLASELFWTAWALVQAEVSEIDFDYAQYAIDRWLRYLARKDEVYRECDFTPN